MKKDLHPNDNDASAEEAYEEYLWGEPGARSFARTRRRVPHGARVVADARVDPADFVPR